MATHILLKSQADRILANDKVQSRRERSIYHLVRKFYLEEIAAVETRHDISSAARHLSVY